MVECAGLEIRYTGLPYRGFESLLLRHVNRSDAGFDRVWLKITTPVTTELV